MLMDEFDVHARRALEADLNILSPKFNSVGDYVEALYKALNSCIEKGGRVVGRKAEADVINDMFTVKGQLSFVSGGPSVGKTKIVRDVIRDLEADRAAGRADQPTVKTIYLNGRSMEAIVDTLRNVSGLDQPVVQMLEVLNVVPGSTLGPAILAHCVSALARSSISPDTSHTVLVLDEANLFFKPENAADSIKLFHALVASTKENMLLSAVLLSEDAGLPCHLEDIGLNTMHIANTLVVGGASPAAALDFLEEMGCGPHLRHLLVSIYGGHVWNITEGVRVLRKVRRGCNATMLRSPLQFVYKAMGTWRQQGGDPTELLAVLEGVARRGFYPIHSTDNRARVLADCNVCTYLTHGTEEFFVDPEVRQDRCGVVATTQLMRVLIASYLSKRA